MEQLVIRINLDNAAFADDVKAEVQGILEKAGERFWDACRASPAEVPLRDSNGNTVGSIKVTE